VPGVVDAYVIVVLTPIEMNSVAIKNPGLEGLPSTKRQCQGSEERDRALIVTFTAITSTKSASKMQASRFGVCRKTPLAVHHRLVY
jgi:hypothetical protein